MYLNETNPIAFASPGMITVGTPTATTILTLFRTQNADLLADHFPAAALNFQPVLPNQGTGPFARQLISAAGGTVVVDTPFAKNITISLAPGATNILVSRLYVGGTVTDLVVVA